MNQKIAWKEIGAFLGLTFTVTYLLNLFMYLTVGYTMTAGAGFLLQGMMLIPAFSAILLRLFVFKSSPIYFRTFRERPRFFFYFFLLYALVYLILGVCIVLIGEEGFLMFALIIAQVLTLGGLLFVVILRLLSGGESFQKAGLSGGRVKYYLLFGLLIVALYGGMTFLNYLFRLGEAVDVKAFLSLAAGGRPTGLENLSASLILLITGLQTVLLSPFIALLITFGEEYGWRGYLQQEMIKLGRVKGIALVGVIWGIWHAPVILMGHNYPGYPVLGAFLMIVYCMALAFIFGLAVLRSGSVWLAAFLHGLNNQTWGFFGMMVYKPKDPVFSFGIGIYSLVVFALVVGLLLFSEEWRGDE